MGQSQGDGVKRILSRVRGKFFVSDGVPIHYTDEGKGEPVVLLHGFVMNADLNWRNYGIIQALSRKYRVLAMDLRGHGLSGKPHAADAYGLHMVEDVRRLLEHVSISRCHLVGYSTGGFITLKFQTLYPERLLSAASAGMAHMGADEEVLETLARIGEALEMRGDFRPLLERLDIPTRGLYPRLRMWVLGRINDTAALAQVIRAFPAFEVTEDALRSNTVPSLTLVGTKDPVAEGAEAMHAVMGNHRLVWLEGGDKLTSLALPGFLAALEEHLRAATHSEETP